jgi:hypothetical protein
MAHRPAGGAVGSHDDPMSDSLGLVRFPDGELRVAYYFGGPGLMVPFLFRLDEAAAVWGAGMEPLMARMDSLAGQSEPKDVEDVQIWADYGDTYWWEGTASRSAGLLVSGIDPDGVTKEMGDPRGEDPRPIYHGRPDWIPTDWA